MLEFPDNLRQKLAEREANCALRSLRTSNNLTDFSSNDYLGFAEEQGIHISALKVLSDFDQIKNGASGSRLLSGNHSLYTQLEKKLVSMFDCQSALVFNSGYDANIGFFSSVPQRSDVIFYDEFIHASIRDGLKMGNAKNYKFKHNDLDDLMLKCRAERTLPAGRQGRSPKDAVIYVVTESVFSMDGDSPDLGSLAQFCSEHQCHLIIDEAHAIGVFGKGLIEELNLQNEVFARIITFGKALGCHGAAILGEKHLVDYLTNFARSLIYTTALHFCSRTFRIYKWRRKTS